MKKISKDIQIIALSMILGAIFVAVVYFFIRQGLGNDSSIIDVDMLTSMKGYKGDILDKKYIYTQVMEKVIVLLVAYICMLKNKKKYIYMMMAYLGAKIGFMASLFVMDMKWIGLLDYVFIIMPCDIVYLWCLKKIVNKLETSKKGSIGVVLDIIKIIGMWGVGIYIEIILKNIMVQQLLIIPKNK